MLYHTNIGISPPGVLVNGSLSGRGIIVQKSRDTTHCFLTYKVSFTEQLVRPLLSKRFHVFLVARFHMACHVTCHMQCATLVWNGLMDGNYVEFSVTFTDCCRGTSQHLQRWGGWQPWLSKIFSFLFQCNENNVVFVQCEWNRWSADVFFFLISLCYF